MASQEPAEWGGVVPFLRRRPLLAGLATVGGLGLVSSAGSVSKLLPKPVEKYEEGDAVTAPSLEIALLQALAAPKDGARDKAITSLVTALERKGGSQLFAARLPGKWTLPWLGGWERIYAESSDSSFLGGPATPNTLIGGTSYEQVGARAYVYGPGDGGLTVEYLHAAPAQPKVLLTRQGGVTNLGGNYFQLDFPTPMQAYAIASAEEGGGDRLATGKPLASTFGAAAKELVMHTTYLSEQLWLLRDEAAERSVVFRRTETQSVMDRRGLVAEGQLKPPDDETVRYGRLLFGESLSDYGGWQETAAAAEKVNKRLLEK